MTKQSDIFRGLREHGIAPPTGVREKLFRILNTGANPFSPSSSRSPYEKTVSAIPLMGFLQQEAIAPSADAFTIIMNRITQERKKARQLKGNLYRYAAIAACLVLAFSGWRIYRTTHTHLATATTGSASAHAAPSTASKSQGGVTGQGLGADTAALAANGSTDKNLPGSDPAAGINSSAGKQATTIVDDYFRNSRVRVDGQAFPLVDNDLLITLTSFHYDEIPEFLSRENNETKIQVDQYAAITISPEMQKMMKKMYTYRSKGTPTRRARKEREKLEEWKKADESRFDGQDGKNPLNPVDLMTFIFK